MNEKCKYRCKFEGFPYDFCLKQNCAVICPRDEDCKVYHSEEYNNNTSALPYNDVGEDIVRYSFERRRVQDKEPVYNK